MDLYLIRHAQSANNAVSESERVADPGLTELGISQAQKLAETVAELRLSRLITSPFYRTLSTTKHIHELTGLTPHVRADIHEQGGCYAGYEAVGRVGQPGMTRTEIEQEFEGYVVEEAIDGDGWWKSRDYETWEQTMRRVRRVIKWLREEFAESDERVALVMHADFKSRLLEDIQTSYLSTPHNASLTHLRFQAGEFQLVDFNNVAHLPDELLTF